MNELPSPSEITEIHIPLPAEGYTGRKVSEILDALQRVCGEISVKGAMSHSLEIKVGYTEADIHRLFTEAFAQALDHISRSFRYHPDHPLPHSATLELDRHGWDVALRVRLHYGEKEVKT